MISLLIADDQELVRAGLRVVLDEPDLTVVAEAGSGTQAVCLARLHRPDLVLMDIRMPDPDGLAATGQILADPALAGVKVVILTTYDLDEYVFRALRLGASGFALKDLDPAGARSSIWWWPAGPTTRWRPRWVSARSRRRPT